MDKAESTLDFGGEGCRLEFDLGAGTFSIFSDEKAVFKDAKCVVVLRKEKGEEAIGSNGEWEVAAAGEDELRLVRHEEWGDLLYHVRRRAGALLLEVGMLWEDSEDSPAIESMFPLSVPAGGIWPGRKSTRSWRFYQNGWQCWTPTGVQKSRRPGDYLYPLFLPKAVKPMVVNTATPVSSEKGSFESEWFAGLADIDEGDSVVIGFIGVRRALSRISVRLGRKPAESKLAAAARFEGKRPSGGEEFWSEPLAVIPGDLSGRNLEAYAELLAIEQGVTCTRSFPAGWGSWYHYFAKVKKDDVLKNLEFITGKRDWLGLELMQVDDGYEKNLGEWLETNEDFPGGMKEIADAIASKGMTPGVWLAPFTVTRGSKLFKDKKEWVLRNRRGRPILAGVNPLWKGRFYGLDITHPEVLSWLHEIFTAVRGQGFRFVKLDFLSTGILEGERYDRTVTRAEAMHNALSVIRNALGEGTYILAAGGPFLLGVGIFDAQRIGGDVAPYWRPAYQPLIRDRSTPGTRNSLVYIFTRCFMHGRLWEGDPDCMLARGMKSKLSLAERQTLASGISVLGGAVMLSDDLSLYTLEEEDLARSMLPPVSARPVCPDLWKREIPRYLVARLEDACGPYILVWAVNWSRFPRTIKMTLEELGVEPARYHAHEFWTGGYLGEIAYSVTVEKVPGHGSAVIRLTTVGDEPRVIGSNIHISQGAVELKGFESSPAGIGMALSSPAFCNAAITLHVPGSGKIDVAGGGDDVKIDRVAKSVYRLEFTLVGTRFVSVSTTAPVI